MGACGSRVTPDREHAWSELDPEGAKAPADTHDAAPGAAALEAEATAAPAGRTDQCALYCGGSLCCVVVVALVVLIVALTTAHGPSHGGSPSDGLPSPTPTTPDSTTGAAMVRESTLTQTISQLFPVVLHSISERGLPQMRGSNWELHDQWINLWLEGPMRVVLSAGDGGTGARATVMTTPGRGLGLEFGAMAHAWQTFFIRIEDTTRVSVSARDVGIAVSVDIDYASPCQLGSAAEQRAAGARAAELGCYQLRESGCDVRMEQLHISLPDAAPAEQFILRLVEEPLKQAIASEVRSMLCEHMGAAFDSVNENSAQASAVQGIPIVEGMPFVLTYGASEPASVVSRPDGEHYLALFFNAYMSEVRGHAALGDTHAGAELEVVRRWGAPPLNKAALHSASAQARAHALQLFGSADILNVALAVLYQSGALYVEVPRMPRPAGSESDVLQRLRHALYYVNYHSARWMLSTRFVATRAPQLHFSSIPSPTCANATLLRMAADFGMRADIGYVDAAGVPSAPCCTGPLVVSYWVLALCALVALVASFVPACARRFGSQPKASGDAEASTGTRGAPPPTGAPVGSGRGRAVVALVRQPLLPVRLVAALVCLGCVIFLIVCPSTSRRAAQARLEMSEAIVQAADEAEAARTRDASASEADGRRPELLSAEWDDSLDVLSVTGDGSTAIDVSAHGPFQLWGPGSIPEKLAGLIETLRREDGEWCRAPSEDELSLSVDVRELTASNVELWHRFADPRVLEYGVKDVLSRFGPVKKKVEKLLNEHLRERLNMVLVGVYSMPPMQEEETFNLWPEAEPVVMSARVAHMSGDLDVLDGGRALFFGVSADVDIKQVDDGERH